MAYGLSQTTPTAATWNNSGQYYTFSSGDSVSSTQINSNFSQLFNQLQNSASQLATILGGTLTSSGALNLNAGGTNQNITLTPSGSGYTILNGSVGIGTSSPSSSALLGMTSTTQGFLPPVMTSTQRGNISSPATGLVVFDTTPGYNTTNSALITAAGTPTNGTATASGGALYVYTQASPSGMSWMPTGPVLLQKYVASGSENTVTFTNLPQTFNHLLIRIVAMAVSLANLYMTVNGITSATYDSMTTINSTNFSVSNGQGAWYIGEIPFTLSPADITIHLPLYSSSVFDKTFTSSTSYVSQSGSSGDLVLAQGANRSITAISTVTLFNSSSTDFAANSIFFLYGEM
jgi:hypothetical protein